MYPSDQAKAAGLKSLAQVSKLTGTSVQTLINWDKNKPLLFAVVLAGSKMGKRWQIPDQLLSWNAQDVF